MLLGIGAHETLDVVGSAAVNAKKGVVAVVDDLRKAHTLPAVGKVVGHSVLGYRPLAGGTGGKRDSCARRGLWAGLYCSNAMTSTARLNSTSDSPLVALLFRTRYLTKGCRCSTTQCYVMDWYYAVDFVERTALDGGEAGETGTDDLLLQTAQAEGGLQSDVPPVQILTLVRVLRQRLA